MYRMLIVDDEEIIVDGLYEVLSHVEELDLDIYRAYSGQEALDRLNGTRMDIVLTDIQMPEITGLDILSHVESNWTEIKVILLTGHDKFPYVYRAIQSPGVRFLLKTESYDKIIDTVRSVIDEIEQKNQHEELFQTIKESQNKAAELHKQDFFAHLLQGNMPLEVSQEQFRQLNIPLRADLPVTLVLGTAQNNDQQINYTEWMDKAHALQQTIRRYFWGHVHHAAVWDYQQHLVLMVQPARDDTSHERLLAFLEGTLEAVQNSHPIEQCGPISFFISSENTHWADVPSKYHHLIQLSGYRIGSEQEALLMDVEQENPLRNEKPLLLQGRMDNTHLLQQWLGQRSMTQLEQYMESNQAEAYFALLQPLLDTLRSAASMHDPQAQEVYYSIALGMLSFINRRQLGERVAFFIGQHQLMHSEHHRSWADAADYLQKMAEILFNLSAGERKSRAEHTIAFLQDYIEQHISEDLSLITLSKTVYLNPSYLSRIYRQETGMKLSAFIDGVRMRRAKEMLTDYSQKIAAVALAVGYDSPASFTRFFKGACGMSPQAWREQPEEPDGLQAAEGCPGKWHAGSDYWRGRFHPEQYRCLLQRRPELLGLEEDLRRRWCVRPCAGVRGE